MADAQQLLVAIELLVRFQNLWGGLELGVCACVCVCVGGGGG